MGRRDERPILLLVGLGLIVVGHKIADAEFGKLGVPHALGATLIALALRS